MKSLVIALSCLTLVFSGCATTPMGPTVLVMPARGKPFEVFQADDKTCRAFALQSIGTTSQESATHSEEESIAAGVALGVLAGVLGGGGQRGAGKGAAIGMLGGAAVGAGSANANGDKLQAGYNNAYMQCMYAKGNNI